MNHLAEQELEKLQRQYRVMDGERRSYCEESQNVIRKQQYVLKSVLSVHSGGPALEPQLVPPQGFKRMPFVKIRSKNNSLQRSHSKH